MTPKRARMILAGGWKAEGLSLNFDIVLFCGIVVFDLEVGFTCELAVVNDFLEGSRPRIARWPRSWHSRNLRGGRERVIDGNTTNSPRRRDTVAPASLFSRAALQRPSKCRLGTRVPLATGTCEWRAASASKSAGLRRDVADVPVATPQKSETARGKGKSLRTPLGGAGAPLATKPTHPHPLFPFQGFLSLESLTQCARGGTTLLRAPGARDPPQGHQPQNWKRGVSETSRGAVAATEFLLLGHQPQNWPLDGMSMPSERRR